MTEKDAYETITLATFVVFTALLLVGAVSTLVRAIRYLHAGQPWPRLLVRDLILIGGLGMVFAMILLVRALGLSSTVVDNVPWALVTGAVAIISIGTCVFFELFVIEKGDRDETGEEPPDA